MSRGTALVTGGGGAIAEALGHRLARLGYDLVLADVNRARMEEVASRLPGSARLVDADLASTDGVGRLADLVEHDLPGLTLLVNNAGLIEPGDAADLRPEQIERQLMVNLVGAVQLSRAAARAMRPNRAGDILSIVSMGGIVALRGSATYSAAKFGLRGFQTSLRAELAPHGIRVMGVFPSGVDTPMLRHEARHASGSPLNFLGKVLTVEQVADACERALRTGRLETYVPFADSVSGRLVGALPWLLPRVEPVLNRIGERGRRRFLATLPA